MSSRSPSTVSSAVRRIAAGSTVRPRKRQLAARQRVVLEHQLAPSRGRTRPAGRRPRSTPRRSARDRVGLVVLAVDQVLRSSRGTRRRGARRFMLMNARELHEARVDAAAARRVSASGTRLIRLLLEPVDRLAGGQLVDRGRADAAVDRAGHQRQAARRAPGASSSDISAIAASAATQGWQIATTCAPGPDARAGTRIRCSMYSSSPKRPAAQRHVARVVPVGDVDVVVGAASCARCRAAAWRSGPTSAPRSARAAAPARRPCEKRSSVANGVTQRRLLDHRRRLARR